MMNNDPKFLAFDECLQRALAGEAVDLVLQDYPDWADELRPMLVAAQSARGIGQSIQVPRAAVARSRARLLDAASTRRQPRKSWLSLALPRYALTSLAVLFVIITTGFTTLAVSAQSLPGDGLYAVKLWSEQARLAIVRDPIRRLELEQSFDQQRVDELHSLAEQARVETVQFGGVIRQVGLQEYQVGSVLVMVGPGTQWQDETQDGYYVQVSGVLQPDGSVVALRIWARTIEYRGNVEQMLAGAWQVSGVTFQLGELTQIDGNAVPGSLVEIQAVLLADDSFMAHTIKVLSTPDGSAAASPSDVIEDTDTLEATSTPQADDTETLEPSDDDGAAETPEATVEDGGDDDGNDNDSSDSSETPEPTDDGGGDDGGDDDPTPTDDSNDDEPADPTPTDDGDDDNDNGD